MTNRKDYWNQDYTNYCKNKVAEANSKIKPNDITISDQIYIESINLLDIEKKDCILEMGVGFGRSIPILSALANQVYALDISESMINEAKKNKKDNVSFIISSSESTPFENNKFNKIVCFACFDAMYQTEVLFEMNRILKIGGKILLTGKNDDYFDSDNQALDAEVGARKKNHPNYFTDYKKLSDNINKFGLKINSTKFFLKREDFGNKLSLDIMPNKFYEYLVILEKVKNETPTSFKISEAISKTFNRMN